MDQIDNPRASNAYQALTTHALAGFRFLGWINGIAALALVAFALGIIGGDVDPPDLLQPITTFAAGLAACAVGMLFSYLAHFSLFRQIANGRAGRGHWLPLLIAAVAYGFSVAAFVIGCWSAASASADSPHDDVGYRVSAGTKMPHHWLAGWDRVSSAGGARARTRAY
jgi:hypothetical protein